MYSVQVGEAFYVHARNACWGGHIYACSSFLATSALDVVVGGQFHYPFFSYLGKKLCFQLKRKLGGHHFRPGRFGKQKYLLPIWQFNNVCSVFQPVAE